MVSVTKFDGRRQAYSREKVLTTSMRMGVSRKDAEKIADEVEARLYDGMPTQEILRIVRKCLHDCEPRLDLRIDLRKSISLLRPKPDFEHFVRLLLQEYGYTVTPNQIVRGRCVEHELDGISRKGNDVVYLEVKHHTSPHTYTGLGVVKEVRATFEDLVEGFHDGGNDIGFNKVLLVCNTKFSNHAKRYSACRSIFQIGWKSPIDGGLEQRVEEKGLYPITLFRDLDRESKEGLGNRGVILLKQVLKEDTKRLARSSGVRRSRLNKLVDFARDMLGED